MDTGAFERTGRDPWKRARLSRELEIVVRAGSRAAKAVDEVFPAESQQPGTPAHTIALDVAPSASGALVLSIDGIKIARIAGERAIAPALEGTLVGFAVRSRRDAAAFHAGVVELENKGVMLLGDKGSGKSTLSLLLANEGGKYFSDELAFMRFSDRAIESFPKAVTLKEGAFSLFPEKPVHFDPVRGPVCYHRPESIGVETQARLIILPHFDPSLEECRVTELEPGETALALVRQTFGGLERNPMMITLVAELAHLPAFIVEYPTGRAAVAAVSELARIVR